MPGEKEKKKADGKSLEKIRQYMQKLKRKKMCWNIPLNLSQM